MAGEALYQRVKRELVAAIESGEFPPDVPFVTQRKICEQFGVSHATAVRALNDLVAEGYVTRRRGQGTFVAPRRPLAGDGSVACVLQFHGPHVSGLLAGVESVCDDLGYRLYLNHCDGDPEREERALLDALDHGVSGIIAYPGQGASTGRGYTEALRRGVPLVLVDRYRPDIATDAVLADNFAAGRDLTEELIACGHSVIATLWDETDVTSVRDRLAGHTEALRAHGLPVRPDLTVLRPYQGEPASSQPAAERRARLSELLHQPGPPTVLLCANGYVLASVAEDLVALGLDIPGDVDLAGMDDAGPFDVLPLTVAAVSLPSREMGVRAMRLLHQRVTGPATAPQRIVLPVTMTARHLSLGHLQVIAKRREPIH